MFTEGRQMGNTKTLWQREDAVLKTTMQFFAEELLPFFHIDGKVVGFGPTELVHLELQKLFEDFNLVMEDGSWKHFEFQRKDGGLKDLRRFRTYEAVTSYHHDTDVSTYVLYSGNITNPTTELKTGINTYRVQPIIMKGKAVEEIFENIKGKIQKGEVLTKGDLVPLTLCVLMGGEMSIKERIIKAFDITRLASKEQGLDVSKIEAVVYAMAEKFMDSVTIEELKEAVGMTRLGQMMFNDGVEQGTEKIKMQIIQKKIEKGMDVETIAEHLELTIEEVEDLIETMNNKGDRKEEN